MTMTMDTGLHRIEWTGLPRVMGGGGFSAPPEKEPRGIFRSILVGFSVALIGLAAWVLLSGYSSKPAESEPVSLATAVTPHQAPPAATESPAAATESPQAATESSQDGASPGPVDAPNPVAAPGEMTAAAEMAPVNGLKISSQSWRRGGLGSKALVTLTLRNANDYPVKDIEISCAFARRDGSHLTDRSRTIHDTVNSKSRKTFARLHVGFVNVNADRSKCSLVTASRQ